MTLSSRTASRPIACTSSSTASTSIAGSPVADARRPARASASVPRRRCSSASAVSSRRRAWLRRFRHLPSCAANSPTRCSSSWAPTSRLATGTARGSASSSTSSGSGPRCASSGCETTSRACLPPLTCSCCRPSRSRSAWSSSRQWRWVSRSSPSTTVALARSSNMTATACWSRRGDVDGLAASIVKLLRDPDQRRTMGRTGRRHAGERFTVQRMAADAGAVYESIASTDRHTGSAAATSGRIGMRVLEGLDVDQFRRALDEDGYVVIRDVVSKERLSELNRDLLDEFNRARGDGELFEGGGFALRPPQLLPRRADAVRLGRDLRLRHRRPGSPGPPGHRRLGPGDAQLQPARQRRAALPHRRAVREGVPDLQHRGR